MNMREWKIEDGRAGSPLPAADWHEDGAHGVTRPTFTAMLLLLGFIMSHSGFCLRALGQQYSIGWSKIGGGGGTSSNAQYSVSGTVGQPDAGSMSGGNYTLTGGYWGVVAAVQTPGAPLLTITLNPQLSTVSVSWPSPSTGFGLQESASVSPASWIPVPPTNSDNGTVKSIVVPIGPGSRFYRLEK